LQSFTISSNDDAGFARSVIARTDVLSDVDVWTGFTDRFTHLRTGDPATDKLALMAAVLADGTNLGLARMADASHGLSYHHLVGRLART
jgi:hypothetical protein